MSPSELASERPDLTNWQLYSDSNGSGTLQTHYVAGEGTNVWVAEVGSSGVRWTLTDHLGSVRGVTDSSGSVIDTINYDAHGAITSESNASVGGRLKYTGSQYDAWSSMTLDGARYYSATTRMFVSMDPSGLGPDSNPYRYVGNSPTNATDPSGHILILGSQSSKDAEELFSGAEENDFADAGVFGEGGRYLGQTPALDLGFGVQRHALGGGQYVVSAPGADPKKYKWAGVLVQALFSTNTAGPDLQVQWERAGTATEKAASVDGWILRARKLDYKNNPADKALIDKAAGLAYPMVTPDSKKAGEGIRANYEKQLKDLLDYPGNEEVKKLQASYNKETADAAMRSRRRTFDRRQDLLDEQYDQARQGLTLSALAGAVLAQEEDQARRPGVSQGPSAEDLDRQAWREMMENPFLPHTGIFWDLLNAGGAFAGAADGARANRVTFAPEATPKATAPATKELRSGPVRIVRGVSRLRTRQPKTVKELDAQLEILKARYEALSRMMGQRGFPSDSSNEGKPFKETLRAGEPYTKEMLLAEFAKAKQTPSSREVLEAIKRGEIKLELNESLDRRGIAETADAIQIHPRVENMETALATIVHEGQHALDMKGRVIPLPGDATPAQRMVAEGRSWAAEIQFVKLNRFKNTPLSRYVDTDPTIVLATIEETYSQIKDAKLSDDVFRDVRDNHMSRFR